MRILHVAGGKDADNVRAATPRRRFDISFVVEFQRAPENLRIGLMPDRHEKTGHAEFFLPTVGTAHADPGYAGIVAEHLLRRGLETDLDVRRLVLCIRWSA